MATHSLVELIHEAYGSIVAIDILAGDTDRCLDDETLFDLCHGSLTGIRHQSAIKHLGECCLCCVDVVFCTELLTSTEKNPVMTFKKRQGKDITPKQKPARES